MVKKLILNKTVLLVGFCVFIGLILRLLYFNAITFGYDQARDALQSISIIRDLHPKIIGPTTDIRGLFHSPLYWYIIAPFYVISGGNPAVARIPIIFIGLLNIVFIYYFANQLFKNKTVALLSSFFMAISFEAVEYSRWLSNPPPAILTIAIFFYGFWLALKQKPVGLPLMFFIWGLSVDFQFFLVYQIIFIIGAFLYLLLRGKETIIRSIKSYYWLYIASVMPWVFYITSELKFKFRGTRALLGFLTKHSDQSVQPILPKFGTFLNGIIRNVSVNIIGVPFNVSGSTKIMAEIVLLFLSLYLLLLFIRTKKLRSSIFVLVLWFISPVIIYPIEKNNSYFLNIGNIYPLIMLFILAIVDITSTWKKYGKFLLVGIICFIVYSNIRLNIIYNKKGEALFSLQDSQVLTDEIKIVDYTYKQSKGKMFSFNTLTNPLFINTTWAYLYNWYGKTKYGYMPIWEGAYLDDFGKEIQFTNASLLKVGMPHYLIVEPPIFDVAYINTYSRYENKRSDLLKVKRIGTHIIETRRIHTLIHFFRDDITNHLQD